MIAEKAADMIKGRQLEPYEPEQGADSDSRHRSPLRGAHSRSVHSLAQAPSNLHQSQPNKAHKPQQHHQQLSAAASHPMVSSVNPPHHAHLNSQHLDLNHNIHHPNHHFIHNKYGSSVVAESIIKKMV